MNKFEMEPIQKWEKDRLFLGSDGRVYKRMNGAVQMVVPFRGFEPPVVVVENWDREMLVPLKEARYLWDTFFGPRNTEAMLLVGKDWDTGKFRYFCPPQKVTAGSVYWDDKASFKEFCQRCQYVGSIHSHPGQSTAMSEMDRGWFTEASASGIHMILGRARTWSLYGSAGGSAAALVKEAPMQIEGTPVDIERAGGLPFEKLVIDVTPKPRKFRGGGKRGRTISATVSDYGKLIFHRGREW